MPRGPNNIPQNPYPNSPIPNNASSGNRLRAGQVADPLGNIFILPRQLDMGLCQGCRNVYGGNGAHAQHQNAHNHAQAQTTPSHQVSL